MKPACVLLLLLCSPFLVGFFHNSQEPDCERLLVLQHQRATRLFYLNNELQEAPAERIPELKKERDQAAEEFSQVTLQYNSLCPTGPVHPSQ